MSRGSWFSQRSWGRVLALLLVVTMTGCSDPGTGGSGLPSGVMTGAPSNTFGDIIEGQIETLSIDSLQVRGTVFLFAQSEIVNSDGAPALTSDLVIGSTVSITPLDPNATIKWRIRIIRGS